MDPLTVFAAFAAGAVALKGKGAALVDADAPQVSTTPSPAAIAAPAPAPQAAAPIPAPVPVRVAAVPPPLPVPPPPPPPPAAPVYVPQPVIAPTAAPPAPEPKFSWASPWKTANLETGPVLIPVIAIDQLYTVVLGHKWGGQNWQAAELGGWGQAEPIRDLQGAAALAYASAPDGPEEYVPSDQDHSPLLPNGLPNPTYQALIASGALREDTGGGN